MIPKPGVGYRSTFSIQNSRLTSASGSKYGGGHSHPMVMIAWIFSRTPYTVRIPLYHHSIFLQFKLGPCPIQDLPHGVQSVRLFMPEFSGPRDDRFPPSKTHRHHQNWQFIDTVWHNSRIDCNSFQVR